tara:strand:+ start:178 stop:573 length:396 start_codon:yes stop_codon:yes gene_type:complete
MKKKICIVISTYNKDVTNKLYKSASKELNKSGIRKFDTIKVSGSFEIPVTIARLAKKYDAFVALGCIIKGQTANFDLISNAITIGIIQLSIINKKPIGNSILTTFNKTQALKRFDRGKEAVKAVLDVLKVK